MYSASRKDFSVAISAVGLEFVPTLVALDMEITGIPRTLNGWSGTTHLGCFRGRIGFCSQLEASPCDGESSGMDVQAQVCISLSIALAQESAVKRRVKSFRATTLVPHLNAYFVLSYLAYCNRISSSAIRDRITLLILDIPDNLTAPRGFRQIRKSTIHSR